MIKTQKVLSIFLASPGDVGLERDLVGVFVDEWNTLWSDELAVHLKLVRWETHAYPSIGEDGQDVINRQIGEEYDVFLGMMWKRFGTPTGRAESGTAEEFDRALTRYRNSKHPHLMFYFKKPNPDEDADTGQLQSILQFKKKLAKEGLLYWEFTLPEQFGQLVRIHLTRYIQTWARHNREHGEPAQEAKGELKVQCDEYMEKVKAQSIAIPKIITDFVKAYLAYTAVLKRTVAEANAMNEDTPDIVWKLSLIELTHEMIRYADAAEHFENKFIAAFSEFIEGVLGAATISIAIPNIKTKQLSNKLAQLRTTLHPVYETTGRYIDQLVKSKSKQVGAMLTATERIIAVHSKYREYTRFGEHLLRESEKLFNKNR